MKSKAGSFLSDAWVPESRKRFTWRCEHQSGSLGLNDRAGSSRRNRLELVGIGDREDRMDALAVRIDHDRDQDAAAGLGDQAGGAVELDLLHGGAGRQRLGHRDDEARDRDRGNFPAGIEEPIVGPICFILAALTSSGTRDARWYALRFIPASTLRKSLKS